jgi:hypothetical protein
MKHVGVHRRAVAAVAVCCLTPKPQPRAAKDDLARIAEAWFTEDMLGMLRQLGLMEAHRAAPEP